MKYQKLENQEAHWKWLYLVKKIRNGENVTRYQESAIQQEKMNELLQLQHYPTLIEDWIQQHMQDALFVKLDQAIRARRKRFFNAEKRSTKKKSIDLEYMVWARLSKHAKKMKMTLSGTIMHMIDEAEHKERYANQVDLMKQNLKDLLK